MMEWFTIKQWMFLVLWVNIGAVAVGLLAYKELRRARKRTRKMFAQLLKDNVDLGLLVRNSRNG